VNKTVFYSKVFSYPVIRKIACSKITEHCGRMQCVTLSLLTDNFNSHWYILRTGKCQQLYDNLLRAVLRATDDVGATADPSTVFCDFESAPMNAI